MRPASRRSVAGDRIERQLWPAAQWVDGIRVAEHLVAECGCEERSNVGLGMLGDVDADRLHTRGIGGQLPLGRCLGYGGSELRGGRRDSLRGSLRDAHDHSLGSQIDVRRYAEPLGGGKDRRDETCRVRERGRGENGLRASACDTPVRDTRRAVKLGRGEPFRSIGRLAHRDSFESGQGPGH